MDKREIRRILEQANVALDEECNGKCSKCKYHLKAVNCDKVYLLFYLAKHDEIIHRIKEEKDNEK